MALKQADGKYKCLFCDYENKLSLHVYSHMQETHDYLLVPLLREELVRIIQYIYTQDQSLITKALYDKLLMYSKYKPKNVLEDQ